MKSSLLIFFALVLFVMPFTSQAQTPRTVLMEEFTGTWCQWCPYGHDSLMTILARVPNTRALCYHVFNSDPYITAEGNVVRDSFLITGAPYAVIDRIVWNVSGSGTFKLSRSIWGQAVSTRLTNSPTSPLSISVTGFFDSTTRAMSGNVLVTAASALTGNFWINIVLTEDDLNYPQTKIDINTNQVFTVNPYFHQFVVRRMITGGLGQQLAPTGFTANQTVSFPFNFTVPVSWNYNKVRFTTFVDRKYTLPYQHRDVEQVYQAPLRNTLTFAPVQLTAFYAEQGTDGITLFWRTAAETNNHGWYLERRVVDGDWQNIGFIEGRGTTQQTQSYDYRDNAVTRGSVYDYRLHQVDNDGSEEFSPVVRVAYYEVPTGITLHQNYPNPFNPTTDITVELPAAQDIRLDVYDAMGRVVATLADGPYNAGYHTFAFTGMDAAGAPLPAGMYFYRLRTPDGSQMKQMQLVK
jgi:hypothetical protein